MERYRVINGNASIGFDIAAAGACLPENSSYSYWQQRMYP
ncbi:hypothetical protein BN2364_0777 [Alloalcanivorax xenomutans]|jgi:hypothetical protein|nr:hypothetical protein BN2364_0777 [Alloalcanivorax xenomutans]